jgi:L-fuconolactonase
MRIDAHQHYWQFNPVRDAWIDDTMLAIRRDFLPADIASMLDASSFDGAIAVQADQSEAETTFLLDLAARDRRVRGVIGWVDVAAPDLEARLAQWRGARLLKGFRHIAQAERDDFLAQPRVQAGIKTLGANGYTFDLLIKPQQLSAATTLVARCPNVQFILDHCAKPPIRAGDDIDGWRAGLQRLASHANVACKISGLVTEASWNDWIFDDLTPYLDAALDAFGAQRLLFGSDWPVCLLAADWYRTLGVVERWSVPLTAAERAGLFGDNAARLYRLDL